MTSANLKTCYSNRHSTRSRSFLGQRVVLFQTVRFSMVHWSKIVHANRITRARLERTFMTVQAYVLSSTVMSSSFRTAVSPLHISLLKVYSNKKKIIKYYHLNISHFCCVYQSQKQYSRRHAQKISC